jgi:hypothetical protein
VSRYGASAVHLVAHVAAFALAGWAILKIAGLGGAQRVLLWFAAAVILHDLVLLPAYTALDRVLQRRLGHRVNAVRVPAALSAMLFLAFCPVILGKGDARFTSVSGLERDGYALRFALACAVLFALGALVYRRGERGGGSRS